MLKERAKEYYLNRDMNCAESVFLACVDEWDLDVPKDTAKAMGGFGGGLGVEHLCGAVSGGIAALGFLVIEERSHESSRMSELSSELMHRFQEELGSVMCVDIKRDYREDGIKCMKAIDVICDIVTDVVERENLV